MPLNIKQQNNDIQEDELTEIRLLKRFKVIKIAILLHPILLPCLRGVYYE